MVKFGGTHVLVYLLVVTVAIVSAMPHPGDGHKHTHFIIHVPHYIHKHHHTHVKKIYIPVKSDDHHDHHDDHDDHDDGW